jgi:hypothetical protein
MVDRYTRDALASYGALRRLNPAEARAELELFDDRLVVEGLPRRAQPARGPWTRQPNVEARLRFGVARRALELTPAGTDGAPRTSANQPTPNGSDRTIRPLED